MYRLLLLFVVSSGLASTHLFAIEPINAFPGVDLTRDWPWWRGPSRDGVAASGQTPPLTWSDTENILWSIPIPGRGQGSPTVVGDQVFVATADFETDVQAVQCLDRKTGRTLWTTPVHQGGFDKKGNPKSTLASGSIACDGQRLFVNFYNAGGIHLTCLARDGKQLWQQKVASFVNHQGFGPSPMLYGNLVIVSADNKGTTDDKKSFGAIAAYDRVTGKEAWKHDRPAKPNYTSPTLLKVAGKEQLFFVGCDLVSSFEPLTGKKNWEVEGATTECVTSVVTDGERIFTSGGYPKNHISAVRADGSGKIDWENKTRVYVPSMIVRDGYLYAVLDAGVAMCMKCDTGEDRLAGTFSSSLVMVNDKLLATNEAGRTFVFAANPKDFTLLHQNQLGTEAFSTPTICGSRIYQRFARSIDGKRQEFVCCIGQAE
jgi:outer membrane protein assembly factor BamB